MPYYGNYSSLSTAALEMAFYYNGMAWLFYYSFAASHLFIYFCCQGLSYYGRDFLENMGIWSFLRPLAAGELFLAAGSVAKDARKL